KEVAFSHARADKQYGIPTEGGGECRIHASLLVIDRQVMLLVILIRHDERMSGVRPAVEMYDLHEVAAITRRKCQHLTDVVAIENELPPMAGQRITGFLCGGRFMLFSEAFELQAPVDFVIVVCRKEWCDVTI